MNEYFIYVRKSSESEERQILSIDSQIKEIKELAKKRGLFISKIFSEARSAKEPGRPVFNEMMKRIYKGNISGVICWKLDRLARNPVDGDSVIWVLKQKNLAIITSTQTYSYLEDNLILMYIEFGMAHKYIDDLSKNVKRGMKARAEMGWFPGRVPIGYLNEKYAEKNEKKIVRDPDRFHLVRKVWELMLTGAYTPSQVLNIANHELGLRSRKTRNTGGMPLAISSIYKMLNNPFYCGIFQFDGEMINGCHESMITYKEFEKVQQLLGKNGKIRPKQRLFTFTGIFKCGECGCSITAEEKNQIVCSVCKFKFSRLNKENCPKCQTSIKQMKNPKLRDYVYYHCTKKKKGIRCTQPYIRKEKIESQIIQKLSKIEISKDFKDWAFQKIKDRCNQRQESIAIICSSIKKAEAQIDRQVDRLLDMKLEELISAEEYQKKRTELLKQKIILQEKIKSAKNKDSFKSVKRAFALANSARKRFKDGDDKTKKRVLLDIGSNFIMKDKNIRIDLKKYLSSIENGLRVAPVLKPRFEPSKDRFKSSNIFSSPQLLSFMWAIVEDVRTFLEEDKNE